MEYMQQLRNGDERGVSPVIGVILMVAIVVILAAVAAVFLTGFADEDVQNAPSFGSDTDYELSERGHITSVTISHASGDTIEASKLSLEVTGAQAVAPDGTSTDVEYTGNSLAAVGTDLSAGDEIKLSKSKFTKVGGGGVDSDEELDLSDAIVRVVWTKGPEQSNVIFVWDGEEHA